MADTATATATLPASASGNGKQGSSNGRHGPPNGPHAKKPTDDRKQKTIAFVQPMLEEVYKELPDEVADITRTYATRLQQLRLQRDHHESTLQYLTKDPTTVPVSCTIKFELGASRSLKEQPEYVSLKSSVEEAIDTCQKEMKAAIIHLQSLEIQEREKEIGKTFCEGLSRIAVALINHARDNDPKIKIAQSMQSQRLADRLVELLIEQQAGLFEFAHLEASPPSPIQQYYTHIGREVPSDALPKNQNQKSSPYNPHHTQFLQGIAYQYSKIITVCFHNSWKQYLKARAEATAKPQEEPKQTAKDGESKALPKENGSKTAPVNKIPEEQSGPKKAPAAASEAGGTKVAPAAATIAPETPPTTIAPEAPKEVSATAAQPDMTYPSAEALKELVHMAVAKETQDLKDTVRHLEQQLTGRQQLSQKDTTAATTIAPSQSAETATTLPVTEGKKGRNRQRNRNKKGPANQNQAGNNNNIQENKDFGGAGNNGESKDQGVEAAASSANNNNQNGKNRGGGRGLGPGGNKANQNATNTPTNEDVKKDTGTATAANGSDVVAQKKTGTTADTSNGYDNGGTAQPKAETGNVQDGNGATEASPNNNPGATAKLTRSQRRRRNRKRGEGSNGPDKEDAKS